MSGVALASGVAACLGAFACAFCAALHFAERLQRAKRREMAYGREVAKARRAVSADGDRSFGLRYAQSLTRRLYAGTTSPLSPAARAKDPSLTRTGSWFKERSGVAGCSKDVSIAGFCEACFRLAFAGAGAGLLVGSLLSAELALLLSLVGAFAMGTAPRRSVQAACRERTVCAQRHLSEMLEVVALGLRSGLSFDRSFALYGSHFDNVFARSCARAHRSWSLGLVTREEALRELAASYDCDQLSRVVDNIVRSLRFGSALTGSLEEAAVQSRASYRSVLEERVAKAPVKMMLPTGTLILPAMLLLVMGPILLELAGGF